MDKQRATEMESIVGRSIRKIWLDGTVMFSIVDVVAALTDDPTPEKRWKVVKRRLMREGAMETIQMVRQIPVADDDEMVCDVEFVGISTLLRIIQSIPSLKAEAFKQGLARLGGHTFDIGDDTGEEMANTIFMQAHANALITRLNIQDEEAMRDV